MCPIISFYKYIHLPLEGLLIQCAVLFNFRLVMLNDTWQFTWRSVPMSVASVSEALLTQVNSNLTWKNMTKPRRTHVIHVVRAITVQRN